MLPAPRSAHPDEDPPGSAPPPRVCGSCAACCTIFRVTPLDKPAWTPCRHLVPLTIGGAGSGDEEPPGRCGVHADPPARICGEFTCLWLRDRQGLLADEERPDRVGVMLTATEPDASGVQTIEARETRPGAARAPAALRLLGRLARCVPIRVVRAPEDRVAA